MALSAIFNKKNKDNTNQSDDQKANINDPNDKEETKDGNNTNDEIKLEICDSKKEKHPLPDMDDKYNAINPDPKQIETTMMLSKRTKKWVHQVVHDVNWSGICDKTILPNKTDWEFNPKSKQTIIKGIDAWIVEILSPTESRKLIELCELYGFEDCGYAKSYRSNTRLITNDKLLSSQLYKRIKQCIPSQYKVDGAIWELCGLNERFRWCKYVKGQVFGRHCDARFARTGTEKSFYTVNIYLNCGKSEFKGGKTRFFDIDSRTNQWGVCGAVVASPGLALMFNQYPDNIEHDGERLQQGIKYLMRTDAMYKRVDSKADDEDEWKRHTLN